MRLILGHILAQTFNYYSVFENQPENRKKQRSFENMIFGVKIQLRIFKHFHEP